MNCASKVPARRLESPVELPGVSDPFVDQDHAGRVLGEQIVKHVPARAGASLVGPGEPFVGGASAKLPGDLAPQRVDMSAVVVLALLPAIGPAPLITTRWTRAQLVQVGTVGDVLDALGILRRRCRREDVVQREHRVRLAPAEVRLKVDHWRGVHVSGDTPDGLGEQVPQSFGQVGAAEELDRIPVLRASPCR